jgi:ribonuclease HII
MILEQAIAAQVAWVSVEEIDRINIFQASLKAMRLAVEGLGQKPEMILVDGKFPLPLSIPQKPLVGGDDRSASIAAASIIAKVARDRFMEEQEKRFPHFSFSRHKGYGTALHLRELQGRGPTELHRRSFEPVRVLLAAAKDAHP